MNTKRPILAGLLTLGLALGGTAATTAAHATPARASGFALCNILQEGQTKVVGGKVYKCTYVRGIGYVWLLQQFYGCGATIRAAKLC